MNRAKSANKGSQILNHAIGNVHAYTWKKEIKIRWLCNFIKQHNLKSRNLLIGICKQQFQTVTTTAETLVDEALARLSFEESRGG